MNVSVKCKISLSKKLRSILKNGGSIMLTCDDINAGQGEGILAVSGKQEDLEQLIGCETSIMLTPSSLVQEIGQPVSRIFSSEPKRTYAVDRSVIDRLACPQPPEQEEVPYSYLSRGEKQTPEEFKETKNEDFIKFVNNLPDLVKMVKEAKNKRSDIDLDHITDVRKRAVAEEQRDMEESIGVDAYVVNDKCASYSINDLNLHLLLNNPRNIGNISAKKLAASRDLWSAFKNGYVKVVSPSEAKRILNKSISEANHTIGDLPIYDSADSAERAMQNTLPKETAEVLNLSMEDLEGETEEMSNLRSASREPRGNARTLSGGIRRSVHSGSPVEDASILDSFLGEGEGSKKEVGSQSVINSQGIKSIARIKR